MQLNIIGWIVFLLVAAIVNRTKTGHTIIFYSLVLILVALVVQNHERILSIITKKE